MKPCRLWQSSYRNPVWGKPSESPPYWYLYPSLLKDLGNDGRKENLYNPKRPVGVEYPNPFPGGIPIPGSTLLTEMGRVVDGVVEPSILYGL